MLALAPAPQSVPSVGLPAGVDASYTLELVREPFPFVSVTFVIHGLVSGETRFALDDWGGVEDVENNIHGLSATDAESHPLTVVYDAGSAGHGPVWTVHHAPGALVVVKYALVAIPHDTSRGSAKYHRVILEPTFFHAIGNTSLVDVRDRPDKAPLHIAFHWRGFAEAGWKVATSFGVEQDFVTTATLEAFRHAIFVAGELHILRRDIGPTHSPLWVAIAGNDWTFTGDAFASLAASVVEAQRSFFHDYDWPSFLISVIPVGPPATDKSFTMSGTGLTHSFATFLSPHSAIKETQDGTGIPWLLSHELFHMWNGERYALAEPEPLGYWFSEGFTNFYARRLLFRAGLFSESAAVKNINETLVRYTLSPVRSAPATRIAADFWKDSSVHDLAYQRGDVVAMLVDKEIRKVSGGARSLDDMMRDLLAAPRDPRPTVSSETLLATIASYTSEEFAERMRKVVTLGDAADMDVKGFAPCLQGKIVRIGPYELGFKDSSKETHRVAGVSPGSSAYRAGLRDGQRLVGWSITAGDPLRTVELTIEEGGVKRKIEYLPQGSPVGVVQLTAEGELSADCRKLL